MKECKNCEFFNGYDYDDGTPLCSYEGRKHRYVHMKVVIGSVRTMTKAKS